MKTWRLPQGAARTRGRAMMSLFQMNKNEVITSVMPISLEQENQDDLFVMFATRRGYVRRNRLADFIHINRNGKIAMKLEQGDEIVSVDLCHAEDDMLLTTREGMCVRFPIAEVRVFSSRTSSGVRGINLGSGDDVIAMSVMHHVDASPDERSAYLRQAAALRRDEETDEEAEDESSAKSGAKSAAKGGAKSTAKIGAKRYQALGKAEQFVLTITSKGYGKRSSSYAYRTIKRGGKGIVAMKIGMRNGELVGSFPVDAEDQIMLITDDGQAIRCSVKDIRIAGRTTQGVKILDTKSQVVSVARIDEDRGEEG